MTANTQTTPYRGGRPGTSPFGAYRGVSRLAVGSLACGVLSALTPWYWMLMVVPVAGIVLGWLALGRIADFPQELTGRKIAIAGIIVSAVLGGAGGGYLVFVKVNEVPFGYDEVTYDQMQPDPNVRGERIPPAILEYHTEETENSVDGGKKIFLRGYMAEVRQPSGLKAFFLCPSIADCPFCTKDPKPTEMVLVILEPNLEAFYTPHEIHVGGRLKIDPTMTLGTPYVIEADYLMQSR